MPDTESLRARLLVLRTDALRQLAEGEGIDGGLLALAAHAGAALEALDAASPVDAAAAERAVVSDDGERILLVAYAGAERAAVVELAPAVAIRLGNQLVAAGARRL